MVYFVRPSDTSPLRIARKGPSLVRPIKIGVAQYPWGRLGDSRGAHRRPDLELLGAIPGGTLTERSLHGRFAILDADGSGRFP